MKNFTLGSILKKEIRRKVLRKYCLIIIALMRVP